MALTTTGGLGPLMRAMREHGREKMVEIRRLVIVMMRVLLATREHGRCKKMVNDLNLVEMKFMVIVRVNSNEKSSSEKTTVFDRWVDNEERVGDFLWAANEPSGGTFQVKMNLLVKFVSKNI